MNTASIIQCYSCSVIFIFLIIHPICTQIAGLEHQPTSNEDENDYPFIVKLHILFAENDEFRSLECGGALISSRVVLTAAHCLKSDDGSFLHAKTVTAMFTIKGEIDFSISTVQWVYKYGDIKGGDDIAMILLPDPLPFICEHNNDERIDERIVSIIRLPIDNFVDTFNVLDDGQLEYGDCKIFSYGGAENDSHLRVTLKKVAPFSINNHSFIGFRNKLDNSSEISICEGDSGSPLICIRNDIKYIIGVAAFTAGRNNQTKALCTGDVGADRFGFFEDIRQHLNWIRNELLNYGLLDTLRQDYRNCGF